MTTPQTLTRPPLVDAHCHLDLFPDPQRTAEDAEKHGVYTIAVTNAPSVFWYTENLARGRSFVRAAAGLHPELVESHGRELKDLWPLLDRTRYVGEIGLDYVTSVAEVRALQRRVFSEILEQCARRANKVLTIHSRRAHADVVSAIGDGYPGRIILHWYSGTLKELNRAIEYGFFFSVNTSMLSSAKGRKLVAALPRERVLTETDGPFIKTSGHGAWPAQTTLVIEQLCALWSVESEIAQRIVVENFRVLLREHGSVGDVLSQ